MTRKTKKIICTWFWRVMVVTIAALLLSITGNQQNIMVMQTDTLDQVMKIRQEVAPKESFEAPEGTILESTYQLTPKERDLVERVTAAEARGEDLQTQMCVAQVIRDRALTWEMTVTQVVTAEGQFASPYQGDIPDSIHLAVADVFDGNVSVLEVPTTHFHDDSVDPYWTEGKIDRGSIGKLRFYGGYEQ